MTHCDDKTHSSKLYKLEKHANTYHVVIFTKYTNAQICCVFYKVDNVTTKVTKGTADLPSATNQMYSGIFIANLRSLYLCLQFRCKRHTLSYDNIDLKFPL